MLELEIKGFRCHVDFKYKWTENGTLNLLQGKSGVGKSSVFSAIYFCLYGGMQHVFSFGLSKTQKCFVKLKTDDVEVYRQKRPELLKTSFLSKTKEKIELEDDPAQECINEMFGPKEVFQACCYIQQNTINPLLNASNAEKLAILNALSFSKDDPDVFLEKLDQNILFLDRDYKAKEPAFKNQCELFSKEVADAKLDPSVMKSAEDLSKIQTSLENYKAQIKTVQQHFLEQQHYKGLYSSYFEQFNSFKKQESMLIEQLLSKKKNEGTEDWKLIYEEKIKPKIRSEIESLQLIKSNSMLRDAAQNLQKEIDLSMEKITKEFSGQDFYLKQHLYTPVILKPELKVQNEDIFKARVAEAQYERFLAIAKKYSINSYDEIPKKIQSFQAVLDMQHKIKAWTSSQQLREQFRNIEAQLKHIEIQKSSVHIPSSEIDSQMQTLHNTIHRLMASKDDLQCPRCNTSLRYVNSVLVELKEKEVKYNEEEINKLMNQIELLKHAKKLFEQESLLQKQLEFVKNQINVSGVDYSEEERKTWITLNPMDEISYKNCIAELSSVKIGDNLKPKHSSVYLQTYANYISALENLNALQHRYSQFSLKIGNIQGKEEKQKEDIDRELLQLQQETYFWESSLDKLAFLKKEQQTLNFKITEILPKLQENHQDLLNSLEREKLNCEYILDMNRKILEMQKRQKDLTVLRDDVVSISENLLASRNLKSIAGKVEDETLESTVDSINNNLAEIAAALFDDPICISLSLTKPVKSTGKIKRQVNFSLQYKGNEYDDIKALSGGEVQRLSLALTLALFQLNTCKFLLLDEPFSNLDALLKDLCIKQCRKYLPC